MSVPFILYHARLFCHSVTCRGDGMPANRFLLLRMHRILMRNPQTLNRSRSGTVLSTQLICSFFLDGFFLF
jgi:hypothetical protein